MLRRFAMLATAVFTAALAFAFDMPARKPEMAIAAKWLGACAADQKPGDMIMADGMKLNVLDMTRAPKRP